MKISPFLQASFVFQMSPITENFKSILNPAQFCFFSGFFRDLNQRKIRKDGMYSPLLNFKTFIKFPFAPEVKKFRFL